MNPDEVSGAFVSTAWCWHIRVRRPKCWKGIDITGLEFLNKIKLSSVSLRITHAHSYAHTHVQANTHTHTHNRELRMSEFSFSNAFYWNFKKRLLGTRLPAGMFANIFRAPCFICVLKVSRRIKLLQYAGCLESYSLFSRISIREADCDDMHLLYLDCTSSSVVAKA